MSTHALLRVGTLLVAAQILVGVIGVGSLRLLTELAPAAVFGEANLVLTALTLGLQLFVAPFTAVQLRYLTHAQTALDKARFKRDILVLALKSTVVLAVLLLCADLAANYAGLPVFPPLLVAAAIAWLFCMTVRNVLIASINAESRRRSYAGFQVMEALLLAACTVGALRIEASVQSFMTGQAIGAALLVALILLTVPPPRVERGEGPASRASVLAKVISYGVPFAPMAAFSWAANLADRYMLAYLLGTAVTGRYIAPFALASRGMTMANTALNDLFRPILFDAVNQGEPQRARRTFLNWVAASLVIGALGLLVIALLGKFLVNLLLAESYRSGALPILLWVSGGYAVYGITQIFETRLLSLDQSSRLLLPMSLGAVSNLLLSFIFISANGMVGAAQGTFASFLVQCLATLGILLHALKKNGAALKLEGGHGLA